MARRLLIVVMNTDPGRPAEVEPPFAQAAVSAALGYDTEVVFTGEGGRLAVRGVAAGIPATESAGGSIYELIREAHAAGVRFKVCSPALERFGEDLIPEVSETVGGAYLVTAAMDEGTVTFTY